MEKVLGSSKFLSDLDHPDVKEFVEIILDILENPEIQKLSLYTQHLDTSRLQHSLNVAYYSYKMAKRWNLDVRSATRAGMLHDFFLYDWRTEHPIEGSHVEVHPQIACRNAKMYFDLNPTEEDAILHHMWPASAVKPKTPEGWVVQAADKYCCALECGTQSLHKLPFPFFATK